MFPIPVTPGEIIITQEISQVPLGALCKKKLKNATLYEVPAGFRKNLLKLLSEQEEKTTLFDLFPSCSFKMEGTEYHLHEKITISSSYSMSWMVKKADSADGLFSLVAIGQNRTARTKDWIGYSKLYQAADIPTLAEYLTVQEVDSSFFEKKAVYKFCEHGTERVN